MTHQYRACCHCQDHIFTVSLPAPLTEANAALCSCSWCAKRGLVWADVDKDQFKFEKGGEGFTSYMFAQGKLDNKSCARCGTFLYSVKTDKNDPEFDMISFNVRALPGFNLWDLKLSTVSKYDDIEPLFVPPKPLLDLPFSDLPEDHQVYNGSCHCGDIQFAVESEPLEKRTDGCDCNCSICSMSGVLWIYPLLKSFHLPESRRAALTTYTFSERSPPHQNQFVFCTRCSCCLYEFLELTEDGTKENDLGLNARLLDVIGGDGKWKGYGDAKFEQDDGWGRTPGYKLPQAPSA